MRQILNFSLLWLLGVFLSNSIGQTTTCTLRGEPIDSTITGLSGLKSQVACLDLSQINGRTIQIPENVTRIDSRGIALCSANTAASINLPPAIVFLLDQSTSMEAAGDPNGQRAIVVRNAIKQFYATTKSGWFSYIEFASDIELPLTQSTNPNSDFYQNQGADSLISIDFIALNDSTVALWSADTSRIQRRAHSGTNYVAPLRRAKEYINALRNNPQVGEISIVMISDGQPFSPNGGSIDTILAVLDSNYEVPGKSVPIHGIYLGQSGTILQQLTDTTQGTYQEVDPTDPNSLSAVLDSVVNKIALGGTPSSVVLNLDGIDYAARRLVADSTGGFQVQLSKSIPLDSGKNVINVDVIYQLENGDSAVRSVSFTLNVSDSPADSNFFDAGNYFVGYCGSYNDLSIVGVAPNTIATIVNPDTLQSLEFEFKPMWFKDSLTTITIRSVNTGDFEKITIPANLDSAGFATYLSSIQMEITNGNYTLNDKIIQVAKSDTVWFEWINPQDSSDRFSWFVLIGENNKIRDDHYIQEVTYQNGKIAITSGPGEMQIHDLNGTRIMTHQLTKDGRTEFALKLKPGVYYITVGCSRRVLNVSGN